MKIKKSISVISLFICIFFSVYRCCLTVYAVETGGHTPTPPASSTEKLKEVLDGFETYLLFVCAQMGAMTDGSFAQMFENYEDYKGVRGGDYWNEDNISIDDDGNIVFSADLVAAIKQALKEYQQEQYGYQILPTLKYDQIPVSAFGNAMEYRSMCELVKTYKYIAISPYTGAWFYCGDISSYSDGTAGFYVTKYDTDYTRVKLMNYITWTIECPTIYSYYPRNPIVPLEEVCTTFEELETQINSYTIDSFNCVKISDVDLYLSATNYAGFSVISYSGSDVLVFNSATSLKNYSVDKRGVFTTSGFYEDTGALTVSIDDLNNSIGNLTDLLDQFKDLIGSQEGSLTEEQLEALLEKFLDEFFNRLGDNDGGDDNNGGGSSGSDIDIPSGFFDSIAGYCNSVLAYLESILLEIQNLEWLTWESSVDEEHSDLFDMFDKIWDDPENGSQEVSDELSASFGDLATGITKKFPFSIPWDVYALFTVFADVDPTQTQSLSSYGLQTYSIQSGDIQPLSDSDMEEHDAPYFELPIVLESYGINESIKVDLEPFSPISTLSRTMLSLLFGVFLMKFTIKVIDLFKGGTDS